MKLILIPYKIETSAVLPDSSNFHHHNHHHHHHRHRHRHRVPATCSKIHDTYLSAIRIDLWPYIMQSQLAEGQFVYGA